MKDSKKVRVLRNILIVLWIIGVTFPIYWTLITSFKSQVDIYGGPYYFQAIDLVVHFFE